MEKRSEQYGWGRFPRVSAEQIRVENASDAETLMQSEEHFCLMGKGRSYGDQALYDTIAINETKTVMTLDTEQSELTCSSSCTLRMVNAFLQAHKLRLNVSPGTEEITVGGAVANDVHGKNHFDAGTFGETVVQMEVYTVNGREIVKPDDSLFRATVGGGGLTGWIGSVTIRVIPAIGNQFDVSRKKLNSVDAVMQEMINTAMPYKACWMKDLHSFLYTEGDWSRGWDDSKAKRGKLRHHYFGWGSNPTVLNVFDRRTYRKAKEGRSVEPAHTFLYPLDRWEDWNRLYPKGFIQIQFAVRTEVFEECVHLTWNAIQEAGCHPFLATIKHFGKREPIGMLSFPREGFCFTVDIRYKSGREEALQPLHDKLVEKGARFYLAKDSVMKPHHMVHYPELNTFKTYLKESKSTIRSHQSNRLRITEP